MHTLKIYRGVLTIVLFGLSFFLLASPTSAATKTLNATADTYVDQSDPNTNFGTGTQIIHGFTTASDKKEIFVKFDLSSSNIPSKANIESAKLYVYLVPGADCASMTGYPYINSVDADWVETTLTWNNRAMSYGGTNGYLSGNVNCDAAYIWGEVTINVQQMVDGIVPNYGFRIGAGNTGGWTRTYYTREFGQPAQLEITYTEPSADTTGPTITDVAVNEYETQADVSWYTNDEYSTSEVRWATTSGGLNSGYQSTSSSVYDWSHALTIEGLTPGTLYYIRVVSADVHGNSSTQDSSFTTTAAAPTPTDTPTPTPTETPIPTEEPTATPTEQPSQQDQSPTATPVPTLVPTPTVISEENSETEEGEPVPEETVSPTESPTPTEERQQQSLVSKNEEDQNQKNRSLLPIILGGLGIVSLGIAGGWLYLWKTKKIGSLKAWFSTLFRKN